jgi:hypothetical protein
VSDFSETPAGVWLAILTAKIRSGSSDTLAKLETDMLMKDFLKRFPGYADSFDEDFTFRVPPR